MKVLHEWAGSFRSVDTRYLTNVAIALPGPPVQHVRGAHGASHREDRDTRLCFHYSVKDGVTVKAHECLTETSNAMLKKFAAEVSGSARAAGLKGEALILVLTSNPDIWKKLEVAW